MFHVSVWQNGHRSLAAWLREESSLVNKGKKWIIEFSVSHLNILTVRWCEKKHRFAWGVRSIIFLIRASLCIIIPAAKHFWQQKVIYFLFLFIYFFRVELPVWSKHLVSCNSVFASENGSLIAFTKRPNQHEWEEGDIFWRQNVAIFNRTTCLN